MKHIESILNFKRYLRRRNLSVHTGKNYLHRLQKFMAWVAVPIESVTSQEVKCYIDFLLEKRLSAQTINSHLVAIRRFNYSRALWTGPPRNVEYRHSVAKAQNI